MHWVSLGTEVGHRNTDGLLGDWELVDSPLLLEGHVAVKDVLVQVVVHVSTEAGAVDVPQEVSAVALESDIKVNAVDISISSVKRNSAESRRVGNRIIAASVPLSWREVRTSWWNSVLVGTLVVDGSDSLGGDTVGERAALARWGVTHLSAHPVHGTWGTGGLNNDIGTLTNGQVDKRSAVWHNWLKVVGNDGHVVAVNLVLDESIGRWVDQAQTVGLARLESELGDTGIWRALESGVAAWVVVLAVDQDVVGQRSRAVGHGLSDQGEVILVEVVRQHDWSYILIVADVRWAVNDDWAKSTASILSAVVRVVPGRTELISAEAVGEGLLWRDWALLDGWNTVVPWGLVHEQTVPMHSSWLTVVARLLRKVIVDGDLNPVTPVGLDERTWELAVDEESIFLDSIRSDLAVGNAEVVLAGDTCVWHGSADSGGAVGCASVAEWRSAARDGADPAASRLGAVAAVASGWEWRSDRWRVDWATLGAATTTWRGGWLWWHVASIWWQIWWQTWAVWQTPLRVTVGVLLWETWRQVLALLAPVWPVVCATV